MPLCIDDKGFIERFVKKSKEERKRFVEANLEEILNPENKELINHWSEYYKSKNFNIAKKLMLRKEAEADYWVLWQECLSLAQDVSDERRTSIKFKENTIDELKLDKEIRGLSETEEEKQERDLAKERKMVEFQRELAGIKKQEEREGRLSEERERLERKKLLDEEEDLARSTANKKIKNIMEDPTIDDREKRRRIAEQQDILEKEISKIEKRRTKLG